MAKRDEVRLAENEALFRLLNENIVEIASSLGDDVRYDFICECSTSTCLERLSLTLHEYEDIRRNGSHFLVSPGHENPEVEKVVSARDGYFIVEKVGVAGRVVRSDDPRT